MKNAKLFWRLLGYFLMAAMFLGLGGGILRAQDTYTLVTDAATLRDGDEVLILSADGHAMAASSNADGDREVVEMTIVDNAITNPDIATAANQQKACVFTLERSSDGKYAIKDNLIGQYIGVSGSYVGFSATASYAEITFADGVIAVLYPGTKYLRYYGDDRIFRYYGKNTTQSNIYFYKKQAEGPAQPYINTDKTEVSYKIQPTANLHENLFFTTENITEDVTVSVASADEGRTDAVIMVAPEEIIAAEAAEFDLTLTTNGLSIGTYKDIITLESGDAKVEVTVNLEVKEMVIYQKVTDVSTLRAGNVVLIASADGFAMTASSVNDGDSKCAYTGTREGVEVAIEGNAIIDPLIAAGANQKRACEFTLEKADGKWAFNDKLNTQKYLSSKDGNADENLPSSSTPFYFSVSIDGNGVATIAPENKTNRSIRYYADYLSTTDIHEVFQLCNGYGKDVSLYKKQVPDAPEPTCDAVTLPADGAATPGEDDVTLVWNAPATGAPANGYKVTVKGPNNYEKSETTTETQIDWAAELSPETEYTFEIVSLCEDDLASDPVTGTFTTLHATNPELKLVSPSPANGAVLTGDVTFAFTTDDFTLDETHLVKAEVKETKTTFEEQLAAPVLKRVYTQTSPLTITGLTDGKYHIDLYMVEVTENEGKKDTAVVGFDEEKKNYVHRDIVVKRPAVYFSTQNLKITTFRGVEGSGKAKVTGWALPAGSIVSFASNSDKFTVTPATLTQAQVMAEGGAEITVTYNGADATATAAITASCTGATSATLAVNARARDTLANLKGLYSRVANDTVLVRGKMVVTHKDTSNNRVWVQDINKENGASMLLFQVTVAKGFTPLKVGDVLENFAGRVTVSNGLYRFTPLAKIEAVEQNHAVYVDTLTADDINNNFATVQSALVCVKDVAFAEKGNFAKATKYTLKQGTKNINFVAFNSADYVGKAIPTVHLYVVGVLSSNTTYGIYIASRKEADLVNAPCPLPADVTVDEVHSTEAALDWEGWPANYSVRYGTTQDLSGATPVAVATSHLKIENLVAETQYYYQIKSVCGTGGYESAWTDVADFTTLAAHAPTIAMNSPVNKPVFTDSVKVSFRITNVTLKADDTSARIVFSDGVTVDNYTDTVYKRAMPSGNNYSVQVILVKDGQPLTPSVQTNVRYFSVDLPDVAAPVFTPKAGRYKDSVEVTLSCATQEATIFYAKNGGEYVAYTAGEKIVIKETATLNAYAAKERMDTSAVVTASYTIYSVLKPEGDLVFAENFSKSTKASTTVISNFGDVTDMSGWTGANMYPEVGKIKGGTSSKAGKLVSREIDLSYDNGKYYVAFFAQAYNNSADSTKIRLTAGDETVLVNDLDKTGMSEYVYMFNNGTANTKITFEALAADYNRFYLDSIRVYQVLPPMIIAPATLRMTTVQGTPVSSEITVRGKLLESDVTVTCPEGNFTVTPATLDKEAVMSEAGVKITVTFNGEVLSDNVEITLVSGDLSTTIAVTATATSSSAIIVEPTLSMTTTQGTPVSEKVSVKGKYLEEDVAVICPDGNFTVSPVTLTKEAVMSEEGAELTVTFNGDKAADTVRLALVSGDLRKTITVTATAVPEPDGEITVVSTLTMSTVVLGIPVSEKVSVKGKYLKEDVTITCPDGNFAVSPATLDKEAVMSEDGAEFTVTFNGSVLSDNVTITLASGDVSKTIAVTATVDECEAPTQLKATVDNNNVTLSWNGTAEQYRVLVMFGTTELRNELVNEKTYSLNNLEVGTYAWAVASICADGEQWTNGEAFEVKPDVANESSDELAYRIYPNPTAGVFYVETAEAARMEIFTLGGVMVRNEMLKAGKNEIRLDRSGIYFVRLTAANGAAVSRVIVR